MHFDFIMAVWGDSYTDLFLNLVLPNQLTPGNLFFFKERRDCTYKIYTTNRDAETIKRSPVYKLLEQTVGTEIISIDSLLAAIPKTHYALTAAHKRAIASASDPGNTGFVFLCPDAVVSEGTFARLWELACAGKRAVMVNGMRLIKETFLPAYLDRFGHSLSAAAPPRYLTGLALRHLHPLSECMFWDSPNFTTIPSHMYWRVNDDGVVLRCFHLHPLFVNPVRGDVTPSTTIDGDFLLRACPDANDIHIVEDSDEMAVFELSPQARTDYLPMCRGQIKRRSSGPLRVSRWAVYNTDAHHRQFVRRVLRVHGSDLTSDWQAVEDRAERVVRSVFRVYPLCRVLCPIPDVILSGIQEIRSRVRIRTRLRHGITWLQAALSKTSTQS